MNLRMGIAEEIRKTIQSRLVLKYYSALQNGNQSLLCVICSRNFIPSGKFCFFIPDDGFVCYSCGQNFAPEMASALNSFDDILPEKLDPTQISVRNALSSKEWQDIYNNLQILHNVSLELSKGISRGIIEAPAGHIGLLHYAKDIIRPVKKDNESDKDYDLRVRTYRIRKIYEKLRSETVERIEVLQKYFIKLGMTIPEDSEK